MSAPDDIDKTRARALAWRIVSPGEAVAILDERERTAPHPTDEGGEATAPEATPPPSVEELAAAVERAWRTADPAAQRQVTAWLVRRASLLGFARWSSATVHSLAAVRLARLALRHHERLPAALRRLAPSACVGLRRGTLELELLVEEIARSGSERFIAAIGRVLQRGRQGRRMDARQRELGVRLGRVIDDRSLGWTRRRAAIELLALSGATGAEAALARALREPNLGLRARALEVLVEHDALVVDDVRFLLDDLVAHPPPVTKEPTTTHDDELARYARILQDAIGRRPPDGGAALLDRCRRAWQGAPASALDEQWALGALAGGYPAEALGAIDCALTSISSARRIAGLHAAARLADDALAGPRLRRLSTDGDPKVAEQARDLLRTRLGETPAIGELDGLRLEEQDLCEETRMRLALLRGRPRESRQAVARLLLYGTRRDPQAERRALALLEVALADDELGGALCGLPSSRGEWCVRLHARFGEPGLALVARLHERYPNGADTWLGALYRLADKRRVRPGEREPLRALAERTLLAGAGDGESLLQTVYAFSLLRPAEFGPRLVERLWAIALAGPGDWQWTATRALRRLPDRGAVNERAAHEMQGALADRDFGRLAAAARVGVRRGSRRCRELALQALAHADDPTATDAMIACAEMMARARCLPSRRILAWLARPESPAFTIACRAGGPALPDEHRALLEAALGSPARGGLAAVEAAIRLATESPDAASADLRFQSALRLAPPLERATLLSLLALRHARFAILRPHLQPLLATDDHAVATTLVTLVSTLGAGQRPFLREVLPTVRDPELRRAIGQELDLVRDEQYWRP